MENKLVIAIAALMVVALAAPVVMAADVSYTASVVTSDVTVTTNSAAFGDLLAGTSKEITGSLTLANTGGAAADVDAKLIDNVSGLHGLISGTNVIGAGNFSLGTNENETALINDGTNIALGVNNRVPASGSVDYDAILTVPAGQAVASYTGTVQLTFTAVA
jgi:hypothetical protein